MQNDFGLGIWDLGLKSSVFILVSELSLNAAQATIQNLKSHI